jgi:hypothetical protein
MALCMTFGGAPCPSLWGYISDTLADLGNALIHDENWDPLELYDPLSSSLYNPHTLPIIHPPSNDRGRVDVYIDDFIVITPDLNDNCIRSSAILGCWSSDAFLRYIRKQVHEFSTGISSKMIQNEEFYTVPLASLDDPRAPNHTLKLATQTTIGHNFKDAIRLLVKVFQ